MALTRFRVGPAVHVLGIYAVVRAGLLVADVLAAHVISGGNLSGPLRTWDSGWYLTIAKSGYAVPAPRVNGHLYFGAGGFSPVFPLCIRAVESLGLPYVAAGYVVSLLGGAAATLLVYKLGSTLYDEGVGLRAAGIFAVFPGMGAVWGMLYAECVGLAFAAGSLLCMLRKRWIVAGLLGALAGATNPMGLALVAPALLLSAQAIVRKESLGPLLTLVLVPLGFVEFALYLGWRFHDMLFWWHVQHEAWGAGVDFGKSLVQLLPHPWRVGQYIGAGWLAWIDIGAIIGGSVAMWRARLSLPISAYVVAVFLMCLLSNQGPKPRLLAWAFPVLIAVVVAVGRRLWQALALAFAMLTPIVLLTYTTYGAALMAP